MTYILKVASPGTRDLSYLEDLDGARATLTSVRREAWRFATRDAAMIVGDTLYQRGWYVTLCRS